MTLSGLTLASFCLLAGVAGAFQNDFLCQDLNYKCGQTAKYGLVGSDACTTAAIKKQCPRLCNMCQDVPSAMSEITLEMVTDTSVTLVGVNPASALTANPDCAISTRIVVTGQCDGNDDIILPNDYTFNAEGQYTIDNLTPGCRYSFQSEFVVMCGEVKSSSKMMNHGAAVCTAKFELTPFVAEAASECFCGSINDVIHTRSCRYWTSGPAGYCVIEESSSDGSMCNDAHLTALLTAGSLDRPTCDITRFDLNTHTDKWSDTNHEVQFTAHARNGQTCDLGKFAITAGIGESMSQTQTIQCEVCLAEDEAFISVEMYNVDHDAYRPDTLDLTMNGQKAIYPNPKKVYTEDGEAHTLDLGEIMNA